MNDLLKQEISGATVTVIIAGEVYPISYTMAAAIAYKKATKKSLFDLEESKLVNLTQDPERWLACLWAGLHQETSPGQWAAPLTLEMLKRIRIADADLANLDTQMWAAFRNDNPKPRETSPNEAAPPDPIGPPAPPHPIAESTGTMLELVGVLGSVAPNS